MLTVTGEYALQAMIYIAREGKPKLAREISSELSIPYRYLSKILSILRHNGLLLSKRGRMGGFWLQQSAGSINLFTVLQAVGRTNQFERCILGYHQCPSDSTCALHNAWGEFKIRILALLKGITLEDLAKNKIDQQVAFKYLREI